MELSPQQKPVVWKFLKAMAWADGKLVENESKRLREWSGKLQVQEDLAPPGKVDPRELTEAIPEGSLRTDVFKALMDIATCDGDYHDLEDLLLDEIARAWWPPLRSKLEGLSEPQRRALWLGLCAIAFADGVVSGKERHLLSNWRRHLQIPIQPEAPRKGGLSELAGVFDDDARRRAVFEALFDLAVCDGELKVEEREVLEHLTSVWKIPFPR